MKINILGTDYEFCVKKYEEDEYFKEHSAGGYCNGVLKEIVLCDMTTYPGFEKDTREHCEVFQRTCLRHEIVHAYFHESGLSSNALVWGESWAENEEMVDWIAQQGPKIFRTWQETGAL